MTRFKSAFRKERAERDALAIDRVLSTILAVALTLGSIAAILVGPSLGGIDESITSFRVDMQPLNDLPVEVSEVINCNCWDGPHRQAERKFKFRISNRSESALRIGGGERSQVRLIVAYPEYKIETLVFPDGSAGTSSQGSLPARGQEVTDASYELEPTRLVGHAHDLFGLPPGWNIYALPPLPNAVTYRKSDGRFTHPTYGVSSL